MGEHQSETEQRRVIEEHGGQFTGAEWMLLMQTGLPLRETVLVVACTPATVKRSAGRPTGLQLQVYETSHGPVAHLLLTLFDRPSSPMLIDLMLNAAAGAADEMLSELAGQDTLQIIFYAARSGSPIGRRVLKLDEALRHGFAQAVAIGARTPASSEQWQRAVAAVDHLRL